MLTACLAAACSPDSEITSEGEYLFFERIGIGQASSVRDTTEWVIRDSLSWVQASPQFQPLAPFDPVRWSQSMVLAVGIPTESGGYHIEIESVEDLGEEVVVSYLFHVPAQDCIALQALAYPFQVVQVRRFDDKPVRFERRRQRYECTWKQN